MSLSIEKKQGKKHARDECKHPTLLCASGWPLEDYTDGGSYCKHCDKKVILDAQPCYAECGCSLKDTSNGESEEEDNNVPMKSGVTISGRWFKVFHSPEHDQDHVEEDDTFDTWEIPFTQDDPQKATLEVLEAMSFVISYTLYACQGYVPRSPEPFVKSTKRTSATLVYIYVTFHMSTSSTNSFYCEWCTTTLNWKCKKATDESFETLNNVEKLVHHMFLPLIQKKME